jgi:outer membrane protein OmpA-like peptidoglycan-associated protein
MSGPALNTNGVSASDRLIEHRDTDDNIEPLASPHVTQGRIILGDFSVNQWSLTSSHLRKLDTFTQLLNNSAGYEVLSIEGRASNTGPESSDNTLPNRGGPGNVELSRLRAEAVVQYLNDRHYLSGFTPLINAFGSSSPLVLSNGEVDGNRSVVIYYTLVTELPYQMLPNLEPPQSILSRDWGITITKSISAGRLGGTQIACGQLKNLQSNSVYKFMISEVGVTVGLPINASIGAVSYTPFTTLQPINALRFNVSNCRLSSFSYPLVGVSISKLIINFRHLVRDEIITNIGVSIGIDAGIFSGLVGRLYLDVEDRRRAQTELRNYNRQVHEFNRQQRERNDFNRSARDYNRNRGL